MPNLKIFVDEALYPACRASLTEALEPIRSMLCRELAVDAAACQFAVMPVIAMADLPRIGVEMQIVPKPDRTRERVLDVCVRLRDMVEAASGTHVAVRAAMLDPRTYVALK